MTTIILPNQTHATFSILGQWFLSGWKLFLSVPFKLFGSCLAIMVTAGLFQLLPAPMGILASKWVGAMLGAAFWPVLDQLSKTRRLSFTGLSTYSGWRGLPLIGLITMLPFAFQLYLAQLMLGEQGIQLVMFGQIGDATQLHIASIFAAAAPIAMFLAFAPAFLLLGHSTVIKAVKNGMRMAVRAWKPMLVLMLINAFVLFLAPYTIALSALLLGPLLVCVNYAAFQALRATV